MVRGFLFKKNSFIWKTRRIVFFFCYSVILIQMQQYSIWHLSARVSVVVLLNLLQEPNCESDLMSVLMCLPWSSRPRRAENWSPKSVWRVLTGTWMSLVVIKELSCCDLEHQPVFEGISSKESDTSSIKSAINKHSMFLFSGINWKNNFKKEKNTT